MAAGSTTSSQQSLLLGAGRESVLVLMKRRQYHYDCSSSVAGVGTTTMIIRRPFSSSSFSAAPTAIIPGTNDYYGDSKRRSRSKRRHYLDNIGKGGGGATVDNCYSSSLRSFSTTTTTVAAAPATSEKNNDTSSSLLNWEDWFPPEEYGNVLTTTDTNTTSNQLDPSNNLDDLDKLRSKEYALSAQKRWILEPLEEEDGDLGLDSSSRHLMRQMQLIYQDGYQNEVVTTDRCHYMMARLFASAESLAEKQQLLLLLQQQQQKKDNDEEDAEYSKAIEDYNKLIRQRIIRAEALLRIMELFWDYVPDIISTATGNKNNNATLFSKKTKPAVKWPLPTNQTYMAVLRKLASLRFPATTRKVDNSQMLMSDIPWICQDIVLRMNKIHATKGMAHLKKPTVEDWNQALVAWGNINGNRDHPHKALHAMEWFLEMKLDYGVRPDASSYSHVLRACAHHNENPRAKELGTKLAMKFWSLGDDGSGGIFQEELLWQSFSPTPNNFVFLMRCFSNIQDDATTKEQYLREIWEGACRFGCVNEYVLYELEQSSMQLFRQLLQNYRRLVDTTQLAIQANTPPASGEDPGGDFKRNYHRMLLEYLPKEWTKRAASNNDKNKQQHSYEDLM